MFGERERERDWTEDVDIENPTNVILIAFIFKPSTNPIEKVNRRSDRLKRKLTPSLV